MIGKLCLGTAAFGIEGYRSDKPMPTSEQAGRILEAARDADIRYYDTAAAYGAAEEILGETGIPSRPGVRIITKLPRSVQTPDDVKAAYDASVKRLGAEPYAVLLHREKAQHEYPACRRALIRLCGTERCAGVSVYDPAEADFALTWADWVQYPANPWDREIRPVADGVVKQVRNVFGRGVLVMPPVVWARQHEAKAAEWFGDLCAASNAWQQWRDFAHGDTLATALRYAYEATNADIVTVGVGDMEQLREIIEVVNNPWWKRMDAAFADLPRCVNHSVTGAQE
jgi:aryl-alcohol dehydrogenase-like predicted oxidoreductase